MGLFKSKKNKEVENEMEDAYVKILGSGCPKCNALEEATREAFNELGRGDVTIGHVKDIRKIAELGVLATPGLIVNGKVISAGKLLTKDEIKELVINL